MGVHEWHSANRHQGCQAASLVPIDLLPLRFHLVKQPGMASTFRDALLWHMDQHHTTIADLARGSGVSSDIIKKLRTRNSSTSAESAIAIARYYGETLEQFIACEVRPEAGFQDLWARLTPDERRIVQAQIEGLLSSRGR